MKEWTPLYNCAYTAGGARLGRTVKIPGYGEAMRTGMGWVLYSIDGDGRIVDVYGTSIEASEARRLIITKLKSKQGKYTGGVKV